MGQKGKGVFMFQFDKAVIELAEDIERRIDPEAEDGFRAQWEEFLSGNFKGGIFTPWREKTSVSAVEVPKININDAIEDYNTMLLMQLGEVSAHIRSRTYCPSLRANYGTGIMTSLFGAELFMMPRETNTLPTTKGCNDPDVIREIVDRGIPDVRSALGKKVLEFGEIVAELFSKYPKMAKYVTVFHPDLQGPLDVVELLWGSEMFYSLYDEPELVHGILSLVTETYTGFMNEWFRLFPASEVMNTHWGAFWHRGKIVLRSDSAMNLSPEMYKEFSLPYDKLLLERFGGGVVHFCGRGDHYIDLLCATDGVTGINLSQPEYNDMEKIYANTVDKGIKIFSIQRARAEADLTRGFHGNLHCHNLK